MSFILDALQKSDHERHKESASPLYSAHGSYPQAALPPKNGNTRFFKPLLYLIILAVPIGAALLFFSAHRDQQEAPATATLAQQVKSPDRHHYPHTQSADSSVAAIDTGEQPAGVVLQDGPALPESLQPPRLSPEKRKVIFQYFRDQSDNTLEVAPKNTEPAAVPDFSELAENIKSRIPPLHFAGHTYSETPDQRMIIINNNIVKEGDMVDARLRLVEITWEGVVLEFAGTRFAMEVR
ncbi:general secretion pathway protein GspB [Desulforhopalus singaporensis]|uniref:Type II secretion system protein B n=1 Tax=Desulforhopalus singaporensis TaxID=91360 RepID=A0A1H0M252_9BACT|nr:general secretion pathway protein GspB [Desulforhopalus singaporensis]SDO74473.1 Type II secretion system protein B [Desulforhopalus singaporensis]